MTTPKQKRLWYCNACGADREKLTPNIIKGKRMYLCEACDKAASEAYHQLLLKREARRRFLALLRRYSASKWVN